MDHDPNILYQELQAEINKKIHGFTNCQAFTSACGRAMERHLTLLEKYKRMTTQWLNGLNIPTKDEFAVISVRTVNLIETVDSMDDAVYSTNTAHHHASSQLREVRYSWEELRSILKVEVKDMKLNNLQTLQAELNELKLLFQIEDKGE